MFAQAMKGNGVLAMGTPVAHIREKFKTFNDIVQQSLWKPHHHMHGLPRPDGILSFTYMSERVPNVFCTQPKHGSVFDCSKFDLMLLFAADRLWDDVCSLTLHDGCARHLPCDDMLRPGTITPALRAIHRYGFKTSRAGWCPNGSSDSPVPCGDVCRAAASISGSRVLEANMLSFARRCASRTAHVPLHMQPPCHRKGTPHHGPTDHSGLLHSEAMIHVMGEGANMTMAVARRLSRALIGVGAVEVGSPTGSSYKHSGSDQRWQHAASAKIKSRLQWLADRIANMSLIEHRLEKWVYVIDPSIGHLEAVAPSLTASGMLNSHVVDYRFRWVPDASMWGYEAWERGLRPMNRAWKRLPLQ